MQWGGSCVALAILPLQEEISLPFMQGLLLILI